MVQELKAYGPYFILIQFIQINMEILSEYVLISHSSKCYFILNLVGTQKHKNVDEVLYLKNHSNNNIQ